MNLRAAAQSFKGGKVRMLDLLFEEELKELLAKCENIIPEESYVVDECTQERDREYELAKQHGVDLSQYKNNEYTGFQLHEIRLGLENKLNVELYDDTAFSWEQMRQIRKGLEEGVNVEVYADALFSDEQMREIRLGLADGLDAESYAKLVYSKTDMHRKRTQLFTGMFYSDKKSFGRTVRDSETGAVIRFSDDLMEAYVTLPEGSSLDKKAVFDMLEDNDIKYGVIDKSVELLAEKGAAAGEVLAAKGDTLEKGSDGYYEMKWRKYEPPTPYERNDGTMDFATVDFVDRVKIGQPVAIYIPAVKGRDGRTVTGMVIEEKSGKDLPKLTGPDLAVRPDGVTYVAKKDGYVIFDEDKFKIDIQDVLVIDGNINRLYGNVFYDGTVRINGNVGEGTIISAKGDVIVQGFIQSSYISAGNKIVAIGGINANDSGYICAQGGVYAEYIENSNIYAGEEVQANYIINSNVSAGTEIIVKGSKGVVCGGTLSAGYKISVQTLGNRSFVKTTVIVGRNASMNERLNSAKSFKAEVERDINTLKKGEEYLRHTVPVDQLSNHEMYIKLGIAVQMKEQSLKRVNGDIAEIESWIKNTERAMINVYGTAYPNSEIQINAVGRVLDQNTFNMSFLLADDAIITKQCER